MNQEQILHLFKKDSTTPPIIIDEVWCLNILTHITGFHLTSLDECRTGEFSTISLYEIPEDKKLFDIATIRAFIRDMSLVPYDEKHIYVLRWIDTWTPEAMNALLKILEECPIYASIILVVEDSEALLETIHSRCIDLYAQRGVWMISPVLQDAFDRFMRGDRESFIQELFTKKFEKSEALGLLRYAVFHPSTQNIEEIEQAIIDIRMSHESPRNILDSLFIIPR
jgi:hypothetical protein